MQKMNEEKDIDVKYLHNTREYERKRAMRKRKQDK